MRRIRLKGKKSEDREHILSAHSIKRVWGSKDENGKFVSESELKELDN